MALQSSFYPVDGRTRTYPQTKHIATKQHAAVYSRLNGTNDWDRLSASAWELINNAVVLDEAFSITTYDQIEIRIADEADELTDSISDISIVASISTEILTTVGLKTEIIALAGVNVAIASLYTDKIKLDSLYADKATLDSLYADKVKLNSLYADKAKLDSLYADKVTLDGLFASKVAIDSLYTDKAKLDSLYADKATLDGLFASKAAIDSLYTDKITLDSLYADKAKLDSIYADKAKLDSIYADKIGLDAIYANLAEILLADDNAAAAATSASSASTSASSASTSASSASTSASNASASELKAQKWAEELEDTEVEVGKYSALHWAAKSQAFALTALQNIVEDLTPQLGGNLDFNGKTADKQAVRQIADASPATTTTHTFDYANGDRQQITCPAGGTLTLAFSNMPTGQVCGFIVDIVNGGNCTITYPASLWANGKTLPTLTVAGTDTLTFVKDKDDVYTVYESALDVGVGV